VKQILVLCEFATRSGGENSLLAVLPRLASDFQLAVAAPASGPLVTALGEQGIEHVCWDVQGPDGRRLDPLQLEESLLQLVTDRRPDILHANSLSMSRLAGRCGASLDCRTIGHLRDMLNLSGRAIGDIARLDRVLAVSDATGQWFIERGLPASRLVTVYNGVDLERFAPRPSDGSLAGELNIPAHAPLLGSIGQLVQRKGCHQLLGAVATTFASDPDPHLVILGDRWSIKQEAVLYEQQLRELASTPPLAGRVHWLGYRDDVARLLPQFTLLVHAARQEPLGRVLLEAAACGVPVVATDVGGTREIFPLQTDGALLVESDDSAELASAIDRLLADSELQQQLGRGSRVTAERRFCVTRAAAALAEQYQLLLSP
jgi:glycosyltransferase involved in cell wall biosynthesis